MTDHCAASGQPGEVGPCPVCGCKIWVGKKGQILAHDAKATDAPREPKAPRAPRGSNGVAEGSTIFGVCDVCRGVTVHAPGQKVAHISPDRECSKQPHHTGISFTGHSVLITKEN